MQKINETNIENLNEIYLEEKTFTCNNKTRRNVINIKGYK